jgi:DNA-binding transcriptional ArsR family regulator
MSVKRDKPLSEPDIVKALAHPLRVRILTVLEQRTASPNQLANEFGVPLGNVSYHVRMLARIGLIKLVSKRQRRGAIEHFYKAEARPVISDGAWAKVPDLVKSAMIQAGLGATMSCISTAAQDGGFNRDDAHLSRTTFEVDEQAWTACSKELSDVFDKLRRLSTQTAERLADAPSDERPRTASVVLMLFEGGVPGAVDPEPAPTSASGNGHGGARANAGRRSAVR